MKFAYLILAHDKPNQLRQLISTLTNKNDIIFIHIDAKSYIDVFKSALSEFSDNVIFIKKRVQVKWGGFSMIEATFELFDEYLKSGFNADYIHLLSNSCLPIVSRNVIDDFFIKNNGKNYIEYHDLLPNKPKFSRISKSWDIDESWKFLGDKRIFNINIKYYDGSQWFSITHECLLFLYEDFSKKEYFYDFFKFSQIPDEMYFQTVLMNSDFKDTIVNNNLRYIDWSENKHHPKILDGFDVKVALNKGCFWARKFNLGID